MTTFTDAAASPPIAAFRIHYVDAPRDFSGIPLAEPGRPVVAALATISTLVALAIIVVVIALIVS